MLPSSVFKKAPFSALNAPLIGGPTALSASVSPMNIPSALIGDILSPNRPNRLLTIARMINTRHK